MKNKYKTLKYNIKTATLSGCKPLYWYFPIGSKDNNQLFANDVISWSSKEITLIDIDKNGRVYTYTIDKEKELDILEYVVPND